MVATGEGASDAVAEARFAVSGPMPTPIGKLPAVVWPSTTDTARHETV